MSKHLCSTEGCLKPVKYAVKFKFYDEPLVWLRDGTLAGHTGFYCDEHKQKLSNRTLAIISERRV